MATKASATLAPVSTSELTKENGTIHVRVLHARNLPLLDFSARQSPVVLVQLEGSSPKSWGSTDPSYTNTTSPSWSEDDNREIELYYDAAVQAHEALLTFEVLSDDSGENLIGTGQLKATEVVKNKNPTPKEYIVRLKESLTSTGASRGELVVQVWYGPPVRKAFRAAQRISKLLDARDHVVSSIWSFGLNAASPFTKYVNGPLEFLKKNRKIGVAVAAFLGVISAGATALFLTIAVPTALFAALTFPFWIIPFLIAATFTAPIWIPILLLVGAFLAFAGAFLVGLGVTSRPVRRKGALLSSRIKHSDLGQKVLYEKTA